MFRIVLTRAKTAIPRTAAPIIIVERFSDIKAI
jgi:hypothetical protein